MNRFTQLTSIFSLLFLPFLATFAAEPVLRPFVLGMAPQASEMAPAVTATRTALAAQGFQVVGSYQPYPTATVIVVTNDELKATAARTPFGGYGAVVRVAVTSVDGKLQLSYSNPTYFAAAYRLDGDLGSVKAKLEAALGHQEDFGSKDGLTATKLRKYRYMFGMERFDSLAKHELATFKTHADALAAVESGLAARRAGVHQVYRVDLPGGTQSVFGVALTQGEGADHYIMERIDFAPIKSTAHLPYEILVADNKVYHLFARFRIAIDFPDLSMMGHNSFMSIMSAPGAIKDALSEVVAAK